MTARRRASARRGEVEEALARVVSRLPGGTLRKGQLEMAELVFEVLTAPGRRHAVIAAGTGTGKSLGYLVPAALAGKRVVVATATKGLQDQLATKDLPLVEGALGHGVRWAVLKGRSNYLCRQRLAELARLGGQEQLDMTGRPSAPATPRAGAALGEQVSRLVEWAGTTASGDRGELDFEPAPAAWASVSVPAEECPGARLCPAGASCCSEQARAAAARADIVVVNHHLLGADLRSGGTLLPEHDALVVDEAHQLEDIVAASLGVELTPGRLRAAAAAARSSLAAAGARPPGAVDGVFEAAEQLESGLAGRAEQRLPAGLGGDLGPAVALAAGRLRRLAAELRLRGGSTGGGRAMQADTTQGCVRATLAVERCREELESLLEAGDETVVWVSGEQRRALRSAPLDVAGDLGEHVFSALPVVLTSATLAPGLAIRLGADGAEVTELDVKSPFDYETNGLLYCASHLPDRRHPSSEARLHGELEELITAAGGRTLALFTSRRAMERAAAALGRRLSCPLHVQGDRPKTALVEAFAGEEESCLFATMGYWQGLDVPGYSLSLVVIDRLPFPRPDDPLIAARREAAGSEAFRAVDLPRAATLLSQGVGRLIRSASDRGVVAVLDPRLATASYSGYLVSCLPRMRRTREKEVALARLSAIRDERRAPAGARRA